MSLAITHFVVGAAITGALVALFLPGFRFSRTVTALGGVWAMLPDVYWVLPFWREPIRALHGSWYAHLFWFHGWMDAVDQESRVVAGVLTAVFVGVTAVSDLLHDPAFRTRVPLLGDVERPGSPTETAEPRADGDATGGPASLDRRRVLLALGSAAAAGTVLWNVTRPLGSADSEVPISRGTDLEERQGTLYAPDVEYALRSTSWSGNPFDVRADVTYDHEATDATITSQLFYHGDDVWRFRFTGTRPGTWTFRTDSDVPELDGRVGRIVVEDDPDARGFLGNVGTKWTWTGTGSAFVPQLVMYAAPHYFYDQPGVVDDDVERFLGEHGFNGVHVYSVADGWTNLPHAGKGGQARPDPDPRTFEALEMLIRKVHAAGGMTHIWAWGDRSRGQTPPGGKDSAADRRLQRYIAARLGPLPGWSMGYGFDLNEWASQGDVLTWHRNMHDHFGWDHYLGGMPRGPNDGTDHSKFDAWNEPFDYSSYEHHRPDYEVYAHACDAVEGQPVLSEDRFAVDGEPETYTMETTRCGLYHSTMAGGVGNVWGYLRGEHARAAGGNRPSGPYPNPEVIDTYATFFFDRDRFRADMTRADDVTNGVALHGSGDRYVVYVEATDRVDLDLSALSEPQPAVAVDTTSAYRERSVGPVTPGTTRWRAPYESDWVLAVGRFDGDSGAPER